MTMKFKLAAALVFIAGHAFAQGSPTFDSMVIRNSLTGGFHLPCANMPALTGDVTSSQGQCGTVLKNTGTAGTYSKVTTNAQGLITSGGAINATDVDNALGFVPFPNSGGTIAGNLLVTGSMTANGPLLAPGWSTGGSTPVAVTQPEVFGSSLIPVYANGHQITATTVLGSNTFTASSTAFALPNTLIYGRFPIGSYVASVAGSVVTVANNQGSNQATVTGSGFLSFGTNRWDATSSTIANVSAANHMWAGAAASGASTPAGLFRPWADDPTVTAMDVQSTIGKTGGYFFTRNSDAPLNSSNAAQAVELQAINDNTVTPTKSWSAYIESWAVSGSLGPQTFGVENSMYNTNAVSAEDPFTVNPSLATINERLDCGNGNPNPLNCSGALDIVNNGAAYAGPAITIGNNALSTATFTNPSALAMPSGANGYGIGWWSGAGKRVWNIYSASTSSSVLNNHIELDTTFLRFLDGAGTTYQQFAVNSSGEVDIGLVSGTAAGNFWRISGAPNASPPTLAIAGNSDTAPFGRIVTDNSTLASNGYVNLNDAARFYRNSSSTSVVRFDGSTVAAPTMTCGGVGITNCSVNILGLGTGGVGLTGGYVYVSSLTANQPVYSDGSDHLTSTPPANQSQPGIWTQTQAVTVANTAAETTVIGTGVGNLTLPANWFVAGRTLQISLNGYHSAVSNPNLQIRVKLGSTVLLDTGSVPTANSANAGLTVSGAITCLTTGVSGTFNADGIYGESGVGAGIFGMVNTAPVTVNTTTTQTINITVQWDTASSGDSFTAGTVVIKAVN
jgi:hypothetical protein